MQQAKKKRMNRIVGRILLVAYFALLIFFVFFSDELGRKTGTIVRRMNTHPFHEIKRFWAMRYTYGWKTTLMNLGLLAMMFSGAIEVVQILTKVGAFDIDDIILNTAGAIIGYVIFVIAKAIN